MGLSNQIQFSSRGLQLRDVIKSVHRFECIFLISVPAEWRNPTLLSIGGVARVLQGSFLDMKEFSGMYEGIFLVVRRND